MKKLLNNIFCFICFDHWWVALIVLPILGTWLFFWVANSGYGLYATFVLMGLYGLCGLGNILNNMQRDKYLRERDKND